MEEVSNFLKEIVCLFSFVPDEKTYLFSLCDNLLSSYTWLLLPLDSSLVFVESASLEILSLSLIKS